jgi:hypothetical protein
MRRQGGLQGVAAPRLGPAQPLHVGEALVPHRPRGDGRRTVRRLAIAGLLGAAIMTCAWACLYIFLPAAPARVKAQLAANRILNMFHSSKSCAHQCSVALVHTGSTRTWRVRLEAPTWGRCFLVDVNTFDYTEQRGLNGIRSATCH